MTSDCRFGNQKSHINNHSSPDALTGTVQTAPTASVGFVSHGGRAGPTGACRRRLRHRPGRRRRKMLRLYRRTNRLPLLWDLALFRRSGLVRSDAVRRFFVCPWGQTTNGPGGLGWLCFARFGDVLSHSALRIPQSNGLQPAVGFVSHGAGAGAGRTGACRRGLRHRPRRGRRRMLRLYRRKDRLPLLWDLALFHRTAALSCPSIRNQGVSPLPLPTSNIKLHTPFGWLCFAESVPFVDHPHGPKPILWPLR